jgi:hypothetical protein
MPVVSASRVRWLKPRNECGDGAEAETRYAELQPDWVQMDIEMPRVDLRCHPRSRLPSLLPDRDRPTMTRRICELRFRRARIQVENLLLRRDCKAASGGEPARSRMKRCDPDRARPRKQRPINDGRRRRAPGNSSFIQTRTEEPHEKQINAVSGNLWP